MAGSKATAPQVASACHPGLRGLWASGGWSAGVRPNFRRPGSGPSVPGLLQLGSHPFDTLCARAGMARASREALASPRYNSPFGLRAVLGRQPSSNGACRGALFGGFQPTQLGGVAVSALCVGPFARCSGGPLRGIPIPSLRTLL